VQINEQEMLLIQCETNAEATLVAYVAAYSCGFIRCLHALKELSVLLVNEADKE